MKDRELYQNSKRDELYELLCGSLLDEQEDQRTIFRNRMASVIRAIHDTLPKHYLEQIESERAEQEQARKDNSYPLPSMPMNKYVSALVMHYLDHPDLEIVPVYPEILEACTRQLPENTWLTTKACRKCSYPMPVHHSYQTHKDTLLVNRCPICKNILQK